MWWFIGGFFTAVAAVVAAIVRALRDVDMTSPPR